MMPVDFMAKSMILKADIRVAVVMFFLTPVSGSSWSGAFSGVPMPTRRNQDHFRAELSITRPTAP